MPLCSAASPEPAAVRSAPCSSTPTTGSSTSSMSTTRSCGTGCTRCRRWHSGTHCSSRCQQSRGHTDHAERNGPADCRHSSSRSVQLCPLRMTTTTISRQSSGGTRRRGSAQTARRSTSLMTRDALELYSTVRGKVLQLPAASTSAGPPPSPYSASHWSLSWCSPRRSRKPPSVNHKHASSSPRRLCAGGRSCAGFSCAASLLSSSASSRPASQSTRSSCSSCRARLVLIPSAKGSSTCLRGKTRAWTIQIPPTLPTCVPLACRRRLEPVQCL